MKIEQIIGKNIEQAIKESGRNNEEVAQVIGVTRQTLNNYINGDTAIDSAKLFRLSRYFGKSVKSFLCSSNSQLSFMFRADNPKKNFTSKDYNFINHIFNQYFEVLKLSGQDKLVVIPESYMLNVDRKINADDEQCIQSIAEKERSNLEIHSTAITDFYEALERRNINIIALEYDNKELDAISAYSPSKGAFIFINDNKEIPEERKLFSLIHEYGHILFHRSLYCEVEQDELCYAQYRTNVNEKVANEFASYFLIPREALNRETRIYNKYFDLKAIINLKRKFSVSAKCILLALKNEKIITSQIYGYLNKQLNEAGYEYTEPFPIPYEEKNQKLYYMLKSLYLKDEITSNMISELLNINLDATRKILKEWSSNG